MDYKAIIFDCDGTLADTMPAHYESWMVVLERYNLEFSEDRFYELAGTPSKDIIQMLLKESSRTADVETIAQQKEESFAELIHLIEPITEVTKVVKQYQGKLPIAVGTGAVRWVCDKTLQQIGLTGCFDAIVSADEVNNPKPHPEAFLLAAERLEVDPSDCCVYEDADHGIEAAKRAGMGYIDVRDFFTPRRVTPI